MGQGLFIPLVHDSIIIIGSRSVYTFGSRFTYKRWVRVLSKIWILVFLSKHSNIFVGSQSMSIEVRIIWYQSTGSKISFLSLLSFVSCYHPKKKKWKKKKEMVIIENIVEDSIKVKYEDESTTHNPQFSVDLLKMTI